MLSTLKKSISTPVVSYNGKVVPVQNNLSVTPSEMLSLSERGIPISSHFDDSQFYDGDSSPRVVLDYLDSRGIDIVDAWNYERTSKSNIRKAIANDIINNE